MSRIKGFYIFILGIVFILAACAPYSLDSIRKFNQKWITGESRNFTGDWWDAMYYPENDLVHLLRIRPEGVSVRLYELNKWSSRIQYDIGDIYESKYSKRPVQFISGMFSNPLDIDGDGYKEGIVNLNDSSTSYLFAYDSSRNFTEILRDKCPFPLKDKAYDTNLFAYFAEDFGNGIRIVAARITRFSGVPRKIYIINPDGMKVEASWEMGAVPFHTFNIIPGKLLSQGFYVYTTITNNGQDFNGLNDWTRYLLTFKYDSTGWKMTKVLERQDKLQVKPVFTVKGNCWLTNDLSRDGNSQIYLVDDNENILSNVLTYNDVKLGLVEVADRNQDGYSDNALLSGLTSIYEIKIFSDQHLEEMGKADTGENIRGIKSYSAPENSGAKYIIGCLSDLGAKFYNDKLNVIGDIPFIKVYLDNIKHSNTYHGNYLRDEINFRSYFNGEIIYSRFGFINLINFHPQVITGRYKYLIPILFVIIGIIILLFSYIKLLKKHHHLEEREYHRTETLKTASIIFRRHPSDVNLYMEYFLSDKWDHIQKQVISGTEAILQNLKLEIPHDNLREEIGVPKSGEARLTNLLISRRIIIHFLKQGNREFDLINKLNFTIDAKYKGLITETERILEFIRQDEILKDKDTLTEAELKDSLRQLEKSRHIAVNAGIRKIYYKIDSRSNDKICGSIRVSLDGKEVKQRFDNGNVDTVYHGKYSPSFTEFMALIGLDPEKDFSEQILFAEEINL